jgi:hypothetical protein
MSNGRVWTRYLMVSAVAVAGYFLTPDDTWTQTAYAQVVGLAATGVIVVGVARYRPAARAAWLWFAAGQRRRPRRPLLALLVYPRQGR